VSLDRLTRSSAGHSLADLSSKWDMHCHPYDGGMRVRVIRIDLASVPGAQELLAAKSVSEKSMGVPSG
jgi:hypothetical protein